MKPFSVSTAIRLCAGYQNSSACECESFAEYVMDLIYDSETGSDLYNELIDESSKLSVGEQISKYVRKCEFVCPVLRKEDYPTLDEYFKDFVPADYFIPMLRSLMDDYVGKTMAYDRSNLEEVLRRINVLDTFLSTLAANTNQPAID